MTSTKFIQELEAAPVKIGGKRIALKSKTVTTREESITTDPLVGEEYRFEAIIGAKFVGTNTLSISEEAYRRRQYDLLLRSVTEHVYGEVREKIYKLIPFSYYINDYDEMQKFNSIVQNILELTKP